MEPVDPSRKHFYLSMIKSGVRLAGCLMAVWYGVVALAAMFAVAEFIGILEEL